jgi:Hemerythrin HHE cation binding domain
MVMNEPKMPSLFGRATAVYGEHARLLRTAKRLQRACVELAEASDDARDETIRLLAEFELRLVDHFEREEADGYFGTLGADRPDLAPRITQLQSDHARIKRALSGARQLLSARDRRTDAAESLASTLRALSTHEREESALMSLFLGRR